MKNCGTKWLLRILLVGVLAHLSAFAQGLPSPPLHLNVMTYNLRYASDVAPNAWPDRRPVMQRTITDASPDIMGTQEGVYLQIEDLDTDLPAYDWIGQGRQGGSKDEYCAIFYRRDRFTPLAYDHFWLSDTPDLVGSMTWGNRWVRMATWVRFLDHESGREFIVLNTHFDHQVEIARQKSAALIRERIAKFDPSIPLIVMGDFNCDAADSPAFDILTTETGLIDTWTAAAKSTPVPTPNTFNGFKPPVFEGKRIDWVLARNPVTVHTASIILPANSKQLPSDHYPVTAELTY